MSTKQNQSEQRTIQSVLNAGSGPRASGRLHRCFVSPDWTEIRLDLDPQAEPDYVGSFTDMRTFFGDGTFDAIWSSHSLEHLYAHEVPIALQEFVRVLKPDGFALVTCPDIEAVAAKLVAEGLDYEAYRSPAGPITVHDIIYGHSSSIMAGNRFMAHKTGFTVARLGRLAMEAGFTQAHVGRRSDYDLWAVLSKSETDMIWMNEFLQNSTAAFLFEAAQHPSFSEGNV